MNTVEFENFLESIDGLKSTYRSDTPPIVSRHFFSIGEGWLSLTKELIEKIISLGWNKEISQVKEKFGGLRFYTGLASDDIYRVIIEYENKSITICEKCGGPGHLTQKRGWYKTLCNGCENKEGS